MSIYSEKCKRTPTPEGVVPCYMCPGECVGDPATPEENDRLIEDFERRTNLMISGTVLKDGNPNPLHFEYRTLKGGPRSEFQGQGWYFYDETWADRHGPYPTIMGAKVALLGYLYHLDYGPFTWRKAWQNLGSMWRTALWVAELPEPDKPDPKEWA